MDFPTSGAALGPSPATLRPGISLLEEAAHDCRCCHHSRRRCTRSCRAPSIRDWTPLLADGVPEANGADTSPPGVVDALLQAGGRMNAATTADVRDQRNSITSQYRRNRVSLRRQ